nr:15712_t:CDS:1 [Entrophospora candida]
MELILQDLVLNKVNEVVKRTVAKMFVDHDAGLDAAYKIILWTKIKPESGYIFWTMFWRL